MQTQWISAYEYAICVRMDAGFQDIVEGLRKRGVRSVSEIPAETWGKVKPEAKAELERQFPPVQLDPIDYGKGKTPSRASIIRALKLRDAKKQEGAALTQAAMKLVEQACDGNFQAWREIADRLDGKPTQSVEMDVHMSLEQLIMASFKLESAPAGQTLDADAKRIDKPADNGAES